MSASGIDVTMPRLSDSMEEGTVLRWLKRHGEVVAHGDELVEIETDKATMPYEAEAAGVLEILAEEGATLPLGAAIARIHPEGMTAAPTGDGRIAPARTGAEAQAAPSQRQAGGSPRSGPGAPNDQTASGLATRRAPASPVARRLAGELDVDLRSITGTGPRGRIVKADVTAVAGRDGDGRAVRASAVLRPRDENGHPPGSSAAFSAPEPDARKDKPTDARGEATIQELDNAQQLIARRMAESKAMAPDFTVTLDIDMSRAVELREYLKSLPDDDVPLPTYNDLVVRAAALALRELPRVNGTYRDGRFELHARVNVGVAVAAADHLTVPTVFDADSKSLGQIARETRALAARVREGTITPAELSGATFTVSNLGMYGVTSFTAILNRAQAGILAIGAVEERAVVRNGAVEIRPTMSATLTSDHRIVYGADAARFLARIREHLQHPRTLLL